MCLMKSEQILRGEKKKIRGSGRNATVGRRVWPQRPEGKGNKLKIKSS